VQLANRKPTATIVASAEAHFDIGSLESSPGTAVAMGKTLNLAAGSVELKLDGGADVIIEGPATFSVTSPVAMNLTSGRISAIAAGRAHGFVVQTPNATVTDLGTQFGVAVDSAGATEVDVFQGQVQVAQARSNGDQQPAAPPTILSTGQAAMVVNGLVKPSGLGAAPQAFVRSLSRPPTIDVVDLICGGDGTSSLRSGAIDQRTGDSGLLQPAFAIDVATPQYHPVPRLPVIDGCFVPNGTIPVDSAGHRFDFGTTSGTCFYQIRAGGKFPWAHRGEKFTAVLGDIDYSQAGHGFFLLHPNAGITFDLRTLRRLHPGMTLTHFRSVVGNTCTSPLATEPAHVSVLVDGRTRFDQPKLWRKQKPVDIDVPLHDSDRFLTLVATDNGISPRYTWIIFGDPWIE
jgi:hypothetical protein